MYQMLLEKFLIVVTSYYFYMIGYYLQVKQLYNKITGQAESLKGLWVAKLNLKGRSALATDEDLLAYEQKKQEVCWQRFFKRLCYMKERLHNCIFFN